MQGCHMYSCKSAVHHVPFLQGYVTHAYNKHQLTIRYAHTHGFKNDCLSYTDNTTSTFVYIVVYAPQPP
jgi:hypothetical protein